MPELVELLTNLSKRSSYDKHFERGTLIAKMPLNTEIVHTVFKKIMVVGPRDLYTVRKCLQVAKNITVIASQSLTSNEENEALAEKVPVVDKGVIRGHLHLGGFLIR